MTRKYLTALPVYNEARHLDEVLPEVLRYSPDVLVVNDGSTDGTADLLRRYPTIQVLAHAKNEGYGAALRDAFRFAIDHDFEILVTIDCDGQHQPSLIPELAAAADDADIVSGSRYLKAFDPSARPPEDRRRINRELTRELNRRLGLRLTDAFCGFKAYRVEALRKLRITETGYAMPLQVWVQAVRCVLRIQEVAVPLIYLDEARAFGGALDDAEYRLRHYYDVLERELAAAPVGVSASRRADE